MNKSELIERLQFIADNTHEVIPEEIEEVCDAAVELLSKKREPWCLCESRGVCLGCLIEQAVMDRYGDQGLLHLRYRVLGDELDREQDEKVK